MKKYLLIVLLVGVCFGQMSLDDKIKGIETYIVSLEEEIEEINYLKTKFEVYDIPYKENNNSYNMISIKMGLVELPKYKELMEKIDKSDEILSYNDGSNSFDDLFFEKQKKNQVYSKLIREHKKLVNLHSNFKVYEPYSDYSDVYPSSNTYNGEGVYIAGSSDNGDYLYHTLSQVKYFTIGTRRGKVYEPYRDRYMNSILCKDAKYKYPDDWKKVSKSQSEKSKKKNDVINFQKGKVLIYLNESYENIKKQISNDLNAFRTKSFSEIDNIQSKINEEKNEISRLQDKQADLEQLAKEENYKIERLLAAEIKRQNSFGYKLKWNVITYTVCACAIYISFKYPELFDFLVSGL